MIPGKEEKVSTAELVDKCRIYLNDNFHKFTEANKIKISLALIAKAMPTEITGQLNVSVMNDITKGGMPLEFKVG